MSLINVEVINRKVQVYRKVALNQRHSKILGRIQGLKQYSGEELQVHYRNSAATIENGYRQIAELKQTRDTLNTNSSPMFLKAA